MKQKGSSGPGGLEGEVCCEKTCGKADSRRRRIAPRLPLSLSQSVAFINIYKSKSTGVGATELHVTSQGHLHTK